MSLLSTIDPIIRSIFSRWTALQLAVSHSMGGSESESKYEAFINAFGEYLTRNIRNTPTISLHESDIQEYLDEILDEEFNTVLDDGSSYELAQLFVRYIQLILQGKLNDVQQELQLQQSMASSIQTSSRNENNDDDSSTSDDSDDDDDDMIEEEEDEQQQQQQGKTQSMDVDEDGWTTVHRKTGGKK
ncbi:unnamed protein product [Adineta steineri]|uniref:Pre-rRNA-processing protein TSR2 homolog n=1 Tax=Adineta steineri TaxID=433720 RepID=A0A819NUD9_9BILA|nr:unnamed protein product [Adineta steineri]CAF1202013.1 unnamed protein product [Adineta steineri]CAF3891739.1 unnamed protein product [Adineta steineri]CAF3984938.1 unnamed protein product [Adineta steineri]CAF3998595.1 unnamed protein product [Adineta steineri]